MYCVVYYFIIKTIDSVMHLTKDIRTFSPEHTIVSLHRKFESNRATLLATIVIGTTAMVDFQKEMFEELLAWISELLSAESFDFDSFKESVEYALQQTNLQLQAFSEKTSSPQHRSISWSIQCVVWNDYLATMIGASGLAIVRGWKTQYILTNDQQSEWIDQFSDLVEWEVHTGDGLLTTWFCLEHYLDGSDITAIHELVVESWAAFVDELLAIVWVRIDKNSIQFLEYLTLTSDLAHTTQEVSKRFEWPIQFLIQKMWWKEQAKNIGMYAAIGCIALFLVVGLFNSFSETTSSTFVSTTTGSPVAITITSIQKEIADFQNMPVTSDQKSVVYENIIDKLDVLDDNNKRANDVSELRKILETQYYQWFNILLVNNSSFFKDPIYTFTQKEKNILGEPRQVFFTDNLLVAGEKGSLIGVINESLRGTLVSAAIDQEFETCSLNIYRNGLYCVDQLNDVYMISKSGLDLLVTAWSFPDDIVGLWIYGSKNFYTLTNNSELIANGSHIQRYSAAGSQTEFGQWLQYQLNSDAVVGSWIQELSIDGNFMVWDPAYGLTQRRRDGASTVFNSRVFELWWWSILQQYSDDTKVISFENSNFVYLFDSDSQTFTVYRSTPYKTNSAHTTNYKLEYFFRIKFAINDFTAKDVFVEEWEQAMLHILSDDGVYKMRLGEYRADYMNRADW